MSSKKQTRVETVLQKALKDFKSEHGISKDKELPRPDLSSSLLYNPIVNKAKT